MNKPTFLIRQCRSLNIYDIGKLVVVGNNGLTCNKGIGSSAFGNCSQLSSVTIGNGVTNIGIHAFYNCNIAKAFWLSNTPPVNASYVNAIINYVSNDNYSFYYRDVRIAKYPYLSSMFEVDGVKYIPVNPSERTCDAVDCVYDSTNVHVVIDKTVNYKGVELAVNNINPYCSYGNEYVNEVKLSSVIGIYDYAFAGCKNLQGIDIPNSTTTLGNYAFAKCSNLAEATIGTGIKVINEYPNSG